MLTLTSFAAAALVCWLIAGFIADRTSQHSLNDALAMQQQLSSSTADNMVQMIASDLALARAIPETMAEVRMIQLGLAQTRNYAANSAGGEPTRRAELLKTPSMMVINTFLHDVQGFSGLDTIWLVNSQGICVAASNTNSPHSFVGTDESTRYYMREVLMGSLGEAYAVGRLTGEPGIFIAAPVYDDGVLVGAVIAKIGLARMRHWVASTGAFVADDNGVIIMAHDSALEGMALPHARATRLSTAQRMDDYRRPNFAELGITSLAGRMKVEAPWVLPAAAAQMVEIPGAAGPLLYTSRSGVNSGLSAHLAEPLHVWPDLQRKHRDVQLIAFALMVGVGLIAYLIATSYRREKLHLRAARRLASQLQASNALLSAEARDDALTGALSRRYFLSLLQKEIDDARASGEPLVLAIADLDHFKQINDRFGHPTGDCALEHFVALCRFELRTSDAIGRLGGEEFGILLTSTALAEGVAVAERVRERVKTRRSPRLPAEVTISTSIGMTALSEGDTVERLLARADRALYAAKSAGRDRTQALTHDDAEPVETAT